MGPVRRRAARADLDLEGLEARVHGRAQPLRRALGARARLARRGRAAGARRASTRGFEVAPLAAPFLEAGHWFDTIDDLRGDPADSPSELLETSPDARSFADDTLIRAGGLALGPSPGDAPCAPAWSGTTGPVPPGGVRVEAAADEPVTLRARRLGDEWIMVGVLPVAPGHAVALRPLPDAVAKPYLLQAAGAARVCPLP